MMCGGLSLGHAPRTNNQRYRYEGQAFATRHPRFIHCGLKHPISGRSILHAVRTVIHDFIYQ
jgi:hypothetical protein